MPSILESKERWVLYPCGCKVKYITIFPEKCPIHNDSWIVTGPVLPLTGESFAIDGRYTC